MIIPSDAELLTGNLPVPLPFAPERQIADGAALYFRPDPLSPDAMALDLTTGVCLLAAVRGALRKGGYRRMPRGARIFVADTPLSPPVEIARERWGSFMLRHGMRVSVTVRFHGGGGGGGKNPLNVILSVVVTIVAIVATALMPAGAPAWWSLGAAAWSGFTYAVGAAIMIGGMMLVNAIAPISAPKLSQAQAKAHGAEDVWSIDGIKNRADLYGPVPLILGKVRFAPRYFAQPYTYLNGNDQYARYLLGVLGHNKVERLRIGDTDVSQYKDVRYNVYENWSGEAFEFYPSAVYQENVGLTLKQASGWHTRTTALNTREIQWEVHFGQGLCHIDKKGNMSARGVALQARYRSVGTEQWFGAFGNVRTEGGTATWSALPGAPVGRPSSSGSTTSTSISASVQLTDSGEVVLAGGTQIGTATKTSTWGAVRDGSTPEGESRYAWSRTGTSHSATAIDKFSGTISLIGDTVSVGAGWYINPDFSVSRATLTPVRVGFGVSVPDGQYEIQIRRLTGDANVNVTTSTTRDEATWATLKSLRSGPVVKYKGIPYTIIELDIKATDQLNGHLDEINAIFTSYAPVWDGEAWTDAPTNNPASLCLMLATTPVIPNPVGMEDMDLDSWAGLYAWCEEYGWAFNSVETSHVYARDEVQSVLSSCRASFAVKNGKFGCVWDAPDKPMTYPYGPRNSWGFQGSKVFVKDEVHGLRYRFLNQERDFQEDEMVVFADGYNDDNATNIVDAEQDGCTDPALIYRMGRLRLADSVWRPEAYTFNTDFSHLFVAKGDRVPLTHDVPMWGIRQARAIDVIYAGHELEGMNRAALTSLALSRQASFAAGLHADGGLAPLSEFTAWLDSLSDDALRDAIDDAGIKDEDWITAVVIDDYVSMEAGKSYAFRYFSGVGASVSYSVETEPGTTNELTLQVPVPASGAPSHDGLIHFGEAGRETHDCIVVSIETEDNLCAKITCQDYAADKIYAALTGPVPPWDSDITIPSRWHLGKPNTPTVLGIISDELALIRTGNGTLLPRIQVNFSVAERRNVTVAEVRVEVREADSGAEWTPAGSGKAQTGAVYAEGVLEGVTYELRLIAISDTGAGSAYSPVYTNTVIGRTTPPPAPVAVYLDGSRLWWSMPEDAPIDIRGWEIWMGFDEADSFSWARRISNEYVTAKEFDLSPWSGWARRVWVRTRDDLNLVSAPVSVAVNLGDMPVDNVIAEILESGRGWPGTVSGGALYPGLGLVAGGIMPAWGDIPMWGAMPWAGGEAQSMVYVTTFVIPREMDGAMLKIEVVMAYGALAAVECAVAGSYPAWGDVPMWGGLPWSGYLDPSAFVTMKNDIAVSGGTAITIRVTTSGAAPSRIQDIVIGFDVEDAHYEVGDIDIDADGTRIPVPEKYFRWISVASVSVQYIEGGEAFTASFVDRGVIVDGFVAQGPLIQCKNINGALVAGNVDVLLQGAKGV